MQFVQRLALDTVSKVLCAGEYFLLCRSLRCSLVRCKGPKSAGERDGMGRNVQGSIAWPGA